MEKEFVPYELSLRMKQLGFDEPCLGYYTHNEKLCSYGSNEINIEYLFCTHKDIYKTYSLAPTFSQAFRWLLDKHYLYGIVLPTLTMNWTFKTMTVVEGMVEVPPYIHVDANDYSTREDAELECLKKLIEIVEQIKSE